jgi:hypothetical protein
MPGGRNGEEPAQRGQLEQYGFVEELSFEVHFAENIAESEHVDRLQDILALRFPRFADDLRVLAFETDRNWLRVEPAESGGLRRAVLDKGGSRGTTYRELERASPTPVPKRRFGDAMIRSSKSSTYLSVQFDDHTPGRASGEQWLFSNSICGSSSASTILGQDRSEFVIGMLDELAALPSLLWGAAFLGTEFAERNLHDVHVGMWALGRDIRCSLPGLFWANVFGAPYIETIGTDRLKRAGARQLSSGPGLMLQLYKHPEQWNTEQGRSAHRSALDELGPEHFFDRHHPDRHTVAPDLGLSQLAPRKPLQALSGDGENFTVLPTVDELLGEPAKPKSRWRFRRSR